MWRFDPAHIHRFFKTIQGFPLFSACWFCRCLSHLSRVSVTQAFLKLGKPKGTIIFFIIIRAWWKFRGELSQWCPVWDLSNTRKSWENLGEERRHQLDMTQTLKILKGVVDNVNKYTRFTNYTSMWRTSESDKNGRRSLECQSAGLLAGHKEAVLLTESGEWMEQSADRHKK